MIGVAERARGVSARRFPRRVGHEIRLGGEQVDLVAGIDHPGGEVHEVALGAADLAGVGQIEDPHGERVRLARANPGLTRMSVPDWSL